MLRIQLICTGRLKERFFIEACEEYAKRLGRYCMLERLELPESGDPERDGEAVLKKLPSPGVGSRYTARVHHPRLHDA